MAQIIVYTGPMFGGKSLKLIDRIMQAEYREQRVVAVRPLIGRDHEPFIQARRVIKGVSHNSIRYPAPIIATREEFREVWSDSSAACLAIDEAQFFPEWIIAELAHALDERSDEDFTIAIAGLNMDYAKEPFGSMPQILAMAAKIRVCAGVCMKCRGRFGKGLYTQRIRGGTEQRQPGDISDYEVRCARCHTIFSE